MFSSRDQENLVHAHQTIAASKPLNQSVRGLAPKTPSNHNKKLVQHAKTVAQDKTVDRENIELGGKKGAGAEKPILLTPAPRDRAPLGAKTTNAKAHAFQTPAQLGVNQGFRTQKRSSIRKPKLKIHHQIEQESELVADPQQVEYEPEIEYCPPKITELPDLPSEDEFGHDGGPEFQPPCNVDLVHGWVAYSAMLRGEDGLTDSERRNKLSQEADDKAFDEMCEKNDRDLRAKLQDDTFSDEGQPEGAGENRGRMHKPSSSVGSWRALPGQNGPSTIRSRAAASALSLNSRPNFAAPTSSAQAKVRSFKSTADGQATMGYAKGRRVASTLKNQDSSSQRPGHNRGGSKSLLSIVRPPTEELGIEACELESRPAWMDHSSDDEEVFQLPLPK